MKFQHVVLPSLHCWACTREHCRPIFCFMLINIKPHQCVEEQIKMVNLITEGCQGQRDGGKEKAVKESMPLARAQVIHVLSRAPDPGRALNCNS